MNGTMLRVDDVDLTFNQGRVNETRALRKMSLSVERGQFVVIVGSNGAGKSTLLNVIAGEHHPDSGRIEIGGRDVTHVADHRRARWIGRVFQDPLAGTAGNLRPIDACASPATRPTTRNCWRFSGWDSRIA
jgi:putative ABC transport system ATP-binding protein